MIPEAHTIERARALKRASEEGKTEALWKLLVGLASRLSVIASRSPQPGDLVVEVTKTGHDPDGIGWLVGRDWAPYSGSCESCGREFNGDAGGLQHRTGNIYSCGLCGVLVSGREIYDVQPLNPHAVVQHHTRADGAAVLSSRWAKGELILYQRWENATFVTLPEWAAELARSL